MSARYFFEQSGRATGTTMKATMLKTPSFDNQELLDAVQRRDLDLVVALKAKRGDVNAASRNGWTPLMLAILNNTLPLAKWLLTNGADPNLTTASEENSCRSPLVVAIRNGRRDMVELLIKHDVQRNTDCRDQTSPLDLARKLTLRPMHQEEMKKIVTLLEND